MLQNYNKILTKLLYSQLHWRKTQIKTSTKKSAYFTHPDFSATKIKKKCANYASKYGIYVHTYLDVLTYSTFSWSLTKSGCCGTSLQVRKSHNAVAAFRW